jgi:glutamate synthase domain-containing protein 3
MNINAHNAHYRDLNERIRAAVADGERDITLDNVRGQRYIGVGLNGGTRITVNGVPGNDLAAFMNGAEIVVRGNAQDGVGNTMNSGKVVVHGDAGDILGYSMRGGRIFVRGSVGYRAGIHMKAYHEHFPAVVIGNRARDYLGEYMAGGILAVLNIESPDQPCVGQWVGTGMHGGVMYLRGTVEAHRLGREVGVSSLSESDWSLLESLIDEFCSDVGVTGRRFVCAEFVKLTPQTTRPYGTLYAY